ncbi:hypothetical protein WN55_03712 [Dufourea novaeangliae]|uniref:Uncharacterized protein n=1 Tax=Dufourea novaeangliae TaxID=178035 RepID=A0A154PLP0_DUFNO|nr:hypothetical protein WN55_03712 [Dufourea novaeangliae]
MNFDLILSEHILKGSYCRKIALFSQINNSPVKNDRTYILHRTIDRTIEPEDRTRKIACLTLKPILETGYELASRFFQVVFATRMRHDVPRFDVIASGNALCETVTAFIRRIHPWGVDPVRLIDKRSLKGS